MFKKTIIMATVVMSQFAFASPAQYQTINKSYDLSCQVNNNGKIYLSVLTLKAENIDNGLFLAVNMDLLGQYDTNLPLIDQKILDYKSEDTFPKTYNYTETRYPLNEIIYKNTVKSGVFGKEVLQAGFNIKFSDKNLSQGVLKLTTYWPKKNNVTICSITEK